MNFLAELRRRNVIRMAGLYLVGAWLVVQIAETLLPIFHTPDWVLQALVVLLALGFLPALVFAWVYELTPEGLKRDAEVDPTRSVATQTAKRMDTLTLVGVVVLLVVIAADRYWPRETTALVAPAQPQAETVPEAPTATDAAGAAGMKQDAGADDGIESGSIAVLPFVNMSADADNEYFSDGISEELLNVLVKVEGLSVASRTSSFAYKGRELSAARIGEELKVAHVLEGSVRKAGNRVRITAQLIDTRSDRHLWSDTFDRELDDIFAIQDEIANAIVTALRDTLGGREQRVQVRADTDNLDAYQSYLKARELFLARERLDESIRLFERSVELDPEFARAWEGLAASAAVIIDWSSTYPGLDHQALTDKSEAAAARALALAPSLSMPWAARSLLLTNVLPIELTEALRLIDLAISADPRNASAILWRGILWIDLGFFDRALADFDRCLAIDPAYANCLRWKAVGLLLSGDAPTAIELYEQGIAAGFNANQGQGFVEPLLRQGNTFAARLLMRELRWPLEIQHAVVTTVLDGRPPDNVRELVTRLSQDPGVRYQWALILRDYALASEVDGLTSTDIEHWDPGLEGLRGSPAFKHLMRRLGAVDYWRTHGFPPQCRPLGEDDFSCEEAP
ncbi:tetratricopeptide repeat protein [Pseudomarimonas salicorniae]|uniref:TolB amino-terminal domain-containing protein n=1 Tax=Pseudomarimonas salicorniae TaxID=2933270 RepID=A0ABT0GFA9_9GAMM|nr:hypothetical protein [Lysobacter sp. CAU 1642]MCK7592722.1 hypothetical protein [Lysobacter sp. CAU 1642]